MINLTEMISGKVTVSRQILEDSSRTSKSPITAVWNVTNICNLKCRHCYASSGLFKTQSELTTEEAYALIDDLKNLGVKILIFSGGEPLLREDIFELAKYARRKSLKTILSTNGTLINDDIGRRIKDSGLSYVGVSIDGAKERHDWFRGVNGSYEKAVEGLKIMKELGIKTGIRFTATKYNFEDLKSVIELLEELNIPRICVYHLIPSGRGLNLVEWDLNHSQKRMMMRFLLDKAFEWREKDAEIETVGSPEDGVYAYLLLKKIDDDLAKCALSYLMRRGGDPSADRLINIDYLGNVHPNQFWWDYTMGNIREKSLEEIWFNTDGFLDKLRGKYKYVKGKCARCPFKEVCSGFRLRALRIYHDPWEEDPGCYLEEEELKKGFIAKD